MRLYFSSARIEGSVDEPIFRMYIRLERSYVILWRNSASLYWIRLSDTFWLTSPASEHARLWLYLPVYVSSTSLYGEARKYFSDGHSSSFLMEYLWGWQQIYISNVNTVKLSIFVTI